MTNLLNVSLKTNFTQLMKKKSKKNAFSSISKKSIKSRNVENVAYGMRNK